MKLFIFTLFLLAAFGCNNAAKPVAETSDAPAANKPSEKPQTAVAHSLENQTPNQAGPAGGKSKWTQGGDPIDTTALDSGIASAEAALAKKPADDTAKKNLGVAYYKRAEALTAARQYASALGDYRRSAKYDPSNAEAKEWIDRIITIYDSINRESPKEGEEPPPLPFKKT